MSAKLSGAFLALVAACTISGCQTAKTSSSPAMASVAPDPAVQTAAAGAPPAAGTPQLATVSTATPPAASLAMKSGAAPIPVKAGPAPAPVAGVCSFPIAAIPPVPTVVGSAAGSIGENAARNVGRTVGATAAKTAVASIIPGFGAVVGQAVVDTQAKEVVKTAEDLRGSVWTATDGAGCGCNLEFAKPGMVMRKNVVTTKGCRTPLWTKAARWNYARAGIGQTDLVFLADDNKTVLAKIDMKSKDYYQGLVNGELVTIWRK